MSPIKPYLAQIHPTDFRHSPLQMNESFVQSYITQLCDNSWLEIPLCALPGEKEAIALLMSNQSSFEVIDHITSLMAEKACLLAPDCIAAVPTMGLEYGSRIAQKLQMPDYVAMGFSHKFWYDDTLKEPVVSTTSPDQKKYMYLDPGLLSRVKGKRVVVIDDVINTGASVLAAIRLLQRAGANVVGAVVALTEGHHWKSTLEQASIGTANCVRAIGHIPVFMKREDHWVAQPETL